MPEEPREGAGGSSARAEAGEASGLLTAIGERLGDRVLLWRGAGLEGSDVDLVVSPDAGEALSRLLASAGLSPRPSDPGHVAWSRPNAGDAALPIDVLHGDAWPPFYPSLAGVRSRAQPTEWGVPVASDADRTLMAAAEALAGRPLAKIARRIRELAATPDARERIAAAARHERLEELATVAEDPDRLAGQARRGRLPYVHVLPLAARSRAARAALGARVRARARGLVRHPPPAGRLARRRGRPRPPYLVTLSGMDGAGKSTGAALLRDELEARGVPVILSWARLGMKGALPDRLANAARMVLRRRGSIADPVASGGPGVREVRDPREAAGRRRPLSWAWILFVALVSVRSNRRAAAERRRGLSVVCDRWTTDAMVDLEVRYGRHRAGEWTLRALSPRPDLELVIELDAPTAARRKPGDQAERVLRAMEHGYAKRMSRPGVSVVDGRLPGDEVRRELVRRLDAMLHAG